MTKEELLSLLRLLSALETLMLMASTRIPEHLHEQMEDAAKLLTREILK